MFNKDVHHRQSIRLRGYDYSQPGHYFLTICCYQKQAVFGDVCQQQVQLNCFGEIAKKHWLNLTEQYSSIKLHEFVIMPNHMHGIIEITAQQPATIGNTVLGQIIRSYKASVTSAIRHKTQSQQYAVWQRNYYEHIIRSEASLLAITQYIRDNPKKWPEDEYYVR
ncbi:transposase [Rheinheimera sp.]|uniref:transposase n=1 Tax=Rheinheimera sp. TaxID=1869214 RepID=UPI004048E9D0